MAHPLDIGKARLRNLVSATNQPCPRLPLVHSTDSYVLEDVLSAGAIAPQECNVFTGEALIYFFYGRPAFRPNLDAAPTGLKHYFPVCLLFKPDWTTRVKRIFPFDSGAFQNGLYGAFLHPRMKLGDFGLEADMATPGKIVAKFFGSNPAYLVGNPEPSRDLDPFRI
jgi:hypothetical protein